MTRKAVWGVLGSFVLLWALSSTKGQEAPPSPNGTPGQLPPASVAQAPAAQNPPTAPATPPAGTTPPIQQAQTQQTENQANQNQANQNENLSQTPSEGAEAAGGANPHMMGDFPCSFTLRPVVLTGTRTFFSTRTITSNAFISVPSFTITNTTQTVPVMGSSGEQFTVTIPVQVVTPTTVLVPVPITTTVPTRRTVPIKVPSTVYVPVCPESGFKLADDESPFPQDRVFFTYNYYNDVQGLDSASSVPHVTTTVKTINGTRTIVETIVPAAAPPSIDLHREMAGFEKTFLDGRASFELRAPALEGVGDGLTSSDFGDLTMVLKYAFFQDRRTGDVISGGLAVTVPTGPAIPTLDGDIHPAVLQPFGGYYFASDRWFIQGFLSVAVPTETQDVTLLFNDVGVGYFVYRSQNTQLITALAPMLEAHVTTPLNHRDEEALIRVPDLVILTAGLHVDLAQNARLNLGVTTPVTGPHVFAVEPLVQFNWRF